MTLTTPFLSMTGDKPELIGSIFDFSDIIRRGTLSESPRLDMPARPKQPDYLVPMIAAQGDETP